MRFSGVWRIPTTRRPFSLVLTTSYGLTSIAYPLGTFNLLFASVLSPAFLLLTPFSHFHDRGFRFLQSLVWQLVSRLLISGLRFLFVCFVNQCCFCMYCLSFLFCFFYRISIGSACQFWSRGERIICLYCRLYLSSHARLNKQIWYEFVLRVISALLLLLAMLIMPSWTLSEFSRLVFEYHIFYFLFGWQIVDQLDSMLCRYALDVNVERAEDVLMHKRLLQVAHDPANRPAIEVRLVQVSKPITTI